MSTEAVAEQKQKPGIRDISIITSGIDLWKVRIIFPILGSSDLERIGQKVSLEAAKGTEIVASEEISLNRAGNDDAGNKSTLRVGRRDFYKEKIEANRRDIMTMKKIWDELLQYSVKRALLN